MKLWERIKRPEVTGVYDPDKDHTNRPVGNFSDHVNQTVDAAIHARRKKDKYGRYNSPSAKATPETVAAMDRMIGEKPRFRDE